MEFGKIDNIIRNKTDSYTMLESDFGKTLEFEAASVKVLTLFNAVSDNDGQTIIVRNIGTANLTITPDGADTCEVPIITPGGCIMLQWSNGDTTWRKSYGNGSESVYDSEWFACTTGTSYTKTHNLGTTLLLYKLYWSGDSGTTIQEAALTGLYTLGDYFGPIVNTITTTQMTVTSGDDCTTVSTNSSGIHSPQTGGHYRIVALALG